MRQPFQRVLKTGTLVLIIGCHLIAQGFAQDAEVDRLIDTLENGSNPQKVAAADRLGEMGPDASGAVDALIETLQIDDVTLTVASARALAKLGPAAKPAIPILIARMRLPLYHSDRRPVAMDYGEALAEMGEFAVPELIKGLEDPSQTESYRGVCTALHKIGPPAKLALDRLIELAGNDDYSTRLAAVYVIEAIGPEAAPAVDVVARLLDSDAVSTYIEPEQFQLQLFALRAITAIGPDARPVAQQVLKLFEEGSLSLRTHAAMALGSIGPIEGVDLVEKLLPMTTNFFDPMRERSLIALGLLGAEAEAALPHLRELAEDKSYKNKPFVGQAIWQITGEADEAVAILAPLCDDIDKGLQAMPILGEMGPAAADAVPSLVEVLSHDDQALRFEAVTALGLIGESAAVALPEIRKLTSDSDPDVVIAARQAIRLIEAEGN